MSQERSSRVLVARVYVTESRARLARLVDVLHRSGRVRGLTVYRGIAGFGVASFAPSEAQDDEGRDLPVVLEFFDEPSAMHATIAEVKRLIAPHHVVLFPADEVVSLP